MGLVEKNVEDILADPNIDDGDKKMLYVKFLFDEDGWVKTLMDIPEDLPKQDLDEMLASGEFELQDDKLVIEKKEWKQEDGKIKFNSGVKGEVLGEAVDPWEEITENADGSIKFLTYTLARDE
jgi:hypothetical protein